MRSLTVPTRILMVAAAVSLIGTLSACSGSDAAEPAAAESASTATVAAEATMAAEESAVASAEAEAAMATGTAVLVDGEAPAERTITITAGQLEPATLTIAVGDIVTFKSGDDAIYAVEVGDLDSATVSGGLIETFQFPEAGEYPAVEIISGSTATISVE